MENMWMKSSVRVKITNQITNLTTTKNVIGNIFGPYHYSCFYHLCTISLSQTQRHMISIHRKVVTRNDLKWPQKYSKTMCHFFSRNAMLKYYRERKREREKLSTQLKFSYNCECRNVICIRIHLCMFFISCRWLFVFISVVVTIVVGAFVVVVNEYKIEIEFCSWYVRNWSNYFRHWCVVNTAKIVYSIQFFLRTFMFT